MEGYSTLSLLARSYHVKIGFGVVACQKMKRLCFRRFDGVCFSISFFHITEINCQHFSHNPKQNNDNLLADGFLRRQKTSGKLKYFYLHRFQKTSLVREESGWSFWQHPDTPFCQVPNQNCDKKDPVQQRGLHPCCFKNTFRPMC